LLASHTEPSGAGTAEMDARRAFVRSDKLFNLPVFGSSLPMRFPDPKSGIQTFPSLSGAALNGMRSVRHIVFHVRNVHGLIAEGPQRFLIGRQFGLAISPAWN